MSRLQFYTPGNRLEVESIVDLLFWDVDTQVDFISPDGNLYVEGAENLKENFAKLVNYTRRHNLQLAGSVDYHDETDSELSGNPDFEETFPPHCLGGDEGSEKISETTPSNPLWISTENSSEHELMSKMNNHDGEIYLRKRQFNVFSNRNTERILSVLDPSLILVFGVTLDVCVYQAVSGFLERDFNTSVVRDATTAINPDRGKELLNKWSAGKPQLLTTEQVIQSEPGELVG